MRVSRCSCRLVDFYGLLIKRFCLLALSLCDVHIAKVAENLGISGMFVLSYFLKNGARSS